MNDYRYEPASPEQLRSDGTTTQFVIRRRKGARPALFLATISPDGEIINLRSQFGRTYALATANNTANVIYVMNQYISTLRPSLDCSISQ